MTVIKTVPGVQWKLGWASGRGLVTGTLYILLNRMDFQYFKNLDKSRSLEITIGGFIQDRQPILLNRVFKDRFSNRQSKKSGGPDSGGR